MSKLPSKKQEEPRVQIKELSSAKALVQVGEEARNFTLIPREEGVYDVDTGKGWTRIYVAKTEKGFWWVHHKGQTYEFDKSRRASSDEGAGEAGSGKVRAPTPAKVAAVLVGEGDSVGEEDGVVILEAMKTEQTLLAGITGRVKEVLVEEGQQVGMDELLVLIEAVDSDPGEKG